MKLQIIFRKPKSKIRCEEVQRFFSASVYYTITSFVVRIKSIIQISIRGQICGFELCPGENVGRGSLCTRCSPDTLVLKQVVRVFQKRRLVSAATDGRESLAGCGDRFVGMEHEIRCPLRRRPDTGEYRGRLHWFLLERERNLSSSGFTWF